MKKLILAVLAVFLLTGVSYAGDVAISSGEQTADATIYSGSALLSAVQIITDGTNDAKLVIKDNGSSGTVVFEATVTGGSHFGGRLFIPPVEIQTDIYCDVTGTGASYIIEYVRN